jgi:hypothetical protein
MPLLCARESFDLHTQVPSLSLPETKEPHRQNLGSQTPRKFIGVTRTWGQKSSERKTTLQRAQKSHLSHVLSSYFSFPTSTGLIQKRKRDRERYIIKFLSKFYTYRYIYTFSRPTKTPSRHQGFTELLLEIAKLFRSIDCRSR